MPLSRDLDGVIQSWNPGAEEIYGYTSAEVLAKSARFFCTRLRRRSRCECAARARGISTNYDTVRMRKDGKQIKVALTVSPIRDSHGAVVELPPSPRHHERWRLEQQCTSRRRWKLSGVWPKVWHTTSTTCSASLSVRLRGPYSGSSSDQIRNAGHQIIDARKSSALTVSYLLRLQADHDSQVIDLGEITAGLGKIFRVLGEDVDVRILQVKA